MADAAWTKVSEYNGAEVWETTLTASDVQSALLGLDNQKIVTVAVTTTGAAYHQIKTTLQNPTDVSPREFVYRSNICKFVGEDYIGGAISGISGIRIVGTITGADTVIAQVTQTPRK